MKLSIIIPTYNEEKGILECLNSLLNQTYKNFEIIVVDDGSFDDTIKKIEDFNKKKKIRILKQNHQGPGIARNLGAKNAKGKILIFIDADITFDKNYLERLTSPLFKDRKNKLIGTTHELEIVENINNIWSRCWGKIRVSKEEAKDVKIFRAIRKDKFLEFGGFDPKYGYADDQTFWFKYKIKPIVAENTICYHKNPESLKSVYNQSKWIGSSNNNFWINLPLLNLIIVLLLILFSLFLIPFVSIKKCYKNKDFSIFHHMLVFITIRYFGTILGYLRKIILKKNYR